jgi:hypothetical protein
MTITTMLLWIGITTVYGFIMYKRGHTRGAIDLVEMQHEAGIVPDKLKMYQTLARFYQKKEEDEG